MKILTTPRNKNELNKLLTYSDSFLFRLEGFSVNFANNFKLEQIKEFNKIIKQNNKQIFISLNKNMHNNDIKKVKEILLSLNELNINGLFFYDVGIVNLKNKLNLNYNLVWAQEHLTTNYNTCNFWYQQKVKYAFISSEITKEEILKIKQNTKMKLIVTLFGYLPMFTSKRHLVDNYLQTFKLDKKGYYIHKENKIYPIIDNNEGTVVYSNYILNGLEEYLELKSNNIDYIFLNNFNIDEKTFLKVVSNFKKLNSKNLEKIKAELNQLITNTSKGFLYTETIYKVKKNEK